MFLTRIVDQEGLQSSTASVLQPFIQVYVIMTAKEDGSRSQIRPQAIRDFLDAQFVDVGNKLTKGIFSQGNETAHCSTDIPKVLIKKSKDKEPG